MENFTPTDYLLKTYATNRVYKDTGWLLTDPEYDKPSLIRAIYDKKQLNLRGDNFGIYKFADWMPINRILEGSSAPVTYRSEKLAAQIGLDNLYITFSGYWPERGAFMKTCSFKECEAYSVCARLPQENKRILVVASAGNTARAFAQVCSDNNIPLLLSVPADNIDALWFEKPLNECVKIISTPNGTDYFDAIHLASIVITSPRFIDEGGAKNVARRDGMSTTLLSAATHIGRIPDYYFQAVGSGTGTIAAWEANLRLIEDGRFGSHKMKLIPSQNLPFTPMYDAWKVGSRALLEGDDEELRKLALQIDAKVLSNRRPPYSIPGGLYDAIKDSEGDMEVANNSDICRMSELFEKFEGIDIHPAAAIALSSVINSLKSGKIEKKGVVMLNVTGGGEKMFKRDKNLFYAKPHIIFDTASDKEMIVKRTEALFD